MTADQFAKYMEATARKLWDAPVAALSSATELRWGAQGSRSVDLEKGTFFDHEAKVGGGVLALIERETGEAGPDAVEWLRRELGADIETLAPRVPVQTARIAKTYDYVDENGEVLLQVVRMEPKSFRQRRPDPQTRDGWNWSVKGVRLVPYRLPELIEAIACGVPVFVVEGEKDVDRLAAQGVVATCNAGGAGKWPESFNEHFVGADVVVIPDNDDAGRAHRDLVASNLLPIAKRVRVLNLPDLPPKGDVSNWLEAGGEAMDLWTLADGEARTWTAGLPVSRFGAIQWADIDRVECHQNWLVEDLMFEGDIGMAYGASGSGKSFLMVHMGLCIARGQPFLGKATRKGSVLYQAGEGGKGLLKRLKAHRQHFNAWREEVPFILMPEVVDLFSPDGDAEAFIEECLAWKAVLPEPLACIVIDTFSTASPGANENASEDMGKVLRAGQRLNKATGAAVIYVHHKNAAGDRERGHTSLRANIDTAIEVIRDEETSHRTLRLAKLKDGDDGLRIGFDLQSVEIGSNDDGKPITSCVVVPAQEESPRTGKRKRLPPGQFKFIKLLDDAITQRGGIMPVLPRIPPNTYGVQWIPFRDLYIAASGRSRADDDLRKALQRDGDELHGKGLIERDESWLWITERGMQCLLLQH
jgi:hypothetical protein